MGPQRASVSWRGTLPAVEQFGPWLLVISTSTPDMLLKRLRLRLEVSALSLSSHTSRTRQFSGATASPAMRVLSCRLAVLASRRTRARAALALQSWRRRSMVSYGWMVASHSLVTTELGSLLRASPVIYKMILESGGCLIWR